MPLPQHSDSSPETKVKEFAKKFFTEYIEGSKFKPHMGTSENAMIQTKMRTADRLERIQFTLINKASGTGKRGTTVLKGAEQAHQDRTFEIAIDLVREGFASHKINRKTTAYDIMTAQKHVAREWISEITKLELSEGLRSVNGKVYDAQVLASADFPVSSAAEKNTWHDDNADRILYGNAISNRVANDHAASLANITAAMKVDHTVLDMMKRMALRNATPKVRPLRIKGDEHWYVVWCDSHAFRDLYEDPVIQNFHANALPKVRDSNPFFTGGDLIWKGMIIKENEDFPTLLGVGSGNADVGTVTLCGAQALGIAWGQTTQFPTETDDYGVLKGVAAEEIRGIEKMRYGSGVNNTDNPKDNGIVTGVFAAEPDQ